MPLKLTPEETDELFIQSESELCGSILILSPKSIPSLGKDNTLHAVLQEELQELEKEKYTPSSHNLNRRSLSIRETRVNC